jgi:hypothetical protein
MFVLACSALRGSLSGLRFVVVSCWCCARGCALLAALCFVIALVATSRGGVEGSLRAYGLWFALALSIHDSQSIATMDQLNLTIRRLMAR